jgi:hypothetical protein
LGELMAHLSKRFTPEQELELAKLKHSSSASQI